MKDKISSMMNVNKSDVDEVKEDADVDGLEEVSLEEINTARDKNYSSIIDIVKREQMEDESLEGPRTTTDVFHALLQMQREQTDLMQTMMKIREENKTEDEEDSSDDEDDEPEPSKDVTIAWDNVQKKTVICKEKTEVEKLKNIAAKPLEVSEIPPDVQPYVSDSLRFSPAN